MIDIYGIKNCDTMKKAFSWLDNNKIEYRFHDYKKEDLEASMAKEWIDQLGWENVINKRGTTWRKLEDDVKASMNDKSAIQIIIDQPSIIKRPLMIKETNITLGFKAEIYAENLL